MDYYIIINTNTFCFPFYFTVSLVYWLLAFVLLLCISLLMFIVFVVVYFTDISL